MGLQIKPKSFKLRTVGTKHRNSLLTFSARFTFNRMDRMDRMFVQSSLFTRSLIRTSLRLLLKISSMTRILVPRFFIRRSSDWTWAMNHMIIILVGGVESIVSPTWLWPVYHLLGVGSSWTSSRNLVLRPGMRSAWVVPGVRSRRRRGRNEESLVRRNRRRMVGVVPR